MIALAPEILATLFVRRRTWSPPAMRGARVWEATIADHLHAAALLEDLARRGGPRTAREYSERDWLRQALDPAVLDAQVTAWRAHVVQHTAKPRSGRPRRSLASYYAQAVHTEAQVPA